MRFSAMSFSASPTLALLNSFTGSSIMPLSDRFTRRTSAACSAIDWFLWITPMPPCCAMAMASSAPVTVSMAALTMGTLRVMLRVNGERMSTSRGSTSL